MRIARVIAGTIVLAAAGAAAGKEVPAPLTDAQLAKIVAAAPAPPVDLRMGMKCRLIDFVDFTNPKDPHPIKDQGTSKVVTGPAGRYRVSAAHRHAFFSTLYRTAGRDRPVLLAIEYPDDGERVMSFMTHDSQRAGRAHLSFSQEGGVYTGGVLPNTNKMQYFTVVGWMRDSFSPLLVVNFARCGSNAAASRMWVYAIDEMPPLTVAAPDPAGQRTLDAFFCLAFLATRDNFGWKSPRSVEHMVDYFNLIGVNRVTMMVYANQSWGAACTVGAWDTDDKGELERILRTMDRKGGVGLVAGIVADGMYGNVKSGGEKVADMPPDRAREVLLKGLDEFLGRYGKYKSLRGIALGSLETIGFADMLQKKQLLDDFVGHVKKTRADLEVLTYVGCRHLQDPHFDGKNGPHAADVVAGWAKAGGGFGDYLADRIGENWRRWKHDRAALGKVAGLSAYEKISADDHRLVSMYRHTPRQALYYDAARSQKRSDLLATPHAAIFSLFGEGWLGLSKKVNFWYDKDWTAPDFNPGGDFALASFANAQALRDRLTISAGSWTVKYFGTEVAVRRFARAFRSLPPVPMAAVKTGPDTARVRWTVHKGRRHVSAVSRIPFAQALTIDGRKIGLGPYELVAFADEGKAAPRVAGSPPAEYVVWLYRRAKDYMTLCGEVRALSRQALPKQFLDPAQRAAMLLEAGKAYAADVAMAQGLMEEMRIRKAVLDPPKLAAPRLKAAPKMSGDLDAWPKAASDIRAEKAEHLTGHVYFPTSWTGPADLSVRVRLGHDGAKLYLGVAVRDSVAHAKDGCKVHLSKSGYLNWRSPEVKYDATWSMGAPAVGKTAAGTVRSFTYTGRRTAGGYVIEGSAPLAAIGARPGGSLGMVLDVADMDDGGNHPAKHRWALKQAMLLPHRPVFNNWADARTCGRLVLDP